MIKYIEPKSLLYEDLAINMLIPANTILIRFYFIGIYNSLFVSHLIYMWI